MSRYQFGFAFVLQVAALACVLQFLSTLAVSGDKAEPRIAPVAVSTSPLKLDALVLADFGDLDGIR